MLDEGPIGPEDYTINPDGTITISPRVTQTLGVGRHHVVITYSDGTSREFTIVIDNSSGRVPTTGENNMLMIVTALMFMTSVALVGISFRIKRKEES